MGSEQSHQQSDVQPSSSNQSRNTNTARLQRGHTIASSTVSKSPYDDTSSQSNDSRPVSPPISVCSDSDLPYISYTNRPIGDSPKIRSKSQSGSRNVRSNSISSASSRRPVKLKQRPVSTAHNIVVVKAAAKEPERDPDLARIQANLEGQSKQAMVCLGIFRKKHVHEMLGCRDVQSIPMFLPVMRGTLSGSSSRDPEILERLQPIHFYNICSRMVTHYNTCATQVASDQHQIGIKIKEIDQRVAKLFAAYVEKQKAYAIYAEQFSKIRSISQQLSRCNNLLNQNIESLEALNNMLDVDNRLEPFVWKTD